MNITHSSLVIVGANTKDPKVFWKGVEIPVQRFSIKYSDNDSIVVLHLPAAPYVAELEAAGITVKEAK